ncbi:MAG TPA: STAS domain-containing protein [Terriglobales bacterium]
MPLTIQSRRVGYVTVVDCTGKLVAGEDSAALEKEVRRCMENHVDVVVNLGAVTFVDSSGLGLLVRLATTSRHNTAGLRFCGANEQIMKVLQLTQLSEVLSVYPSEEKAIAAVSEKTGAPSPRQFATGTVLCVDESMDLLAYLRESLAKAGLPTQSAKTIPDAILLLRTVRPSVIVAGPMFVTKVTAIAGEMKIPIVALDSEFLSRDAGEAIGELLEQLRNRLQKGSA